MGLPTDEREGPLSLELFASPSLKSISIVIMDLEALSSAPLPLVQSCSRLFAQTLNVAPNVHYLKLELHATSPSLCSPLSDWTVLAKNLTSFYAKRDPVRPDAFLSLASLPRLSDLGITFSDLDWPRDLNDVFNNLPKLPFPSLENLSINTQGNMEFACSLLRVVRSGRVECLEVYITETSAPALSQFLALIPTTRFSAALVTLDLTVKVTDEDHEQHESATLPPILFDYDLRPLFKLDLRHFSIWGCEVATTHDFLHDLACAWPRLEFLDFCTLGIGRDSPYKISLYGLLPFAQYCPNLHTLCIPMDASRIPSRLPEIPSIVGTAGHDHRQFILGVGYGRPPPFGDIASIAALAGWIARCFPGCDYIKTTWAGVGGRAFGIVEFQTAAEWQRVAAIMQRFQFVRTQERRLVEDSVREHAEGTE